MCLPYDLEALDQASAHTKEETDGEAPAESEKQPTKAGKKMGRKLQLVKKCKGGVCGGRDLPLSAAYTAEFCRAVFNAWIAGWVMMAKP